MQSTGRGNWTAHSPKAALKLLRVVLIALPLLAIFAPKQAHAYAWMIKRGYPSCPACHADPSGGELLTMYGRMISGATLSTNWSGESSMGRNDRALQRKIALRAPESFAAHAKNAGPEADDVKLDDDAKAADSSEAKEGEAASEGEGDEGASEGEGAPAEAPTAAASSESEFDPTPFLFGAVTLPDWLLLGGSYRHLNILPIGDGKFRTFPMMMDVYGQVRFGSFIAGGSLGGARVAAGSPYARRSQITANQGKDWNLISRTHYVGYDILPELTVRAGRLNLPFGVRIPEHTMWVRQATNTDRESSQEHGVAVAYVGETLRGEIMGIAGNYQVNPDKYRNRGYSGYLEYAASSSASVGVSSLVTFTDTDRATNSNLKTTHQLHGAMARAGFGEMVAILAEVDAIITSRREAGYVGFAQVDVEPLGGFHVMVTGEMLDQGYTKPVPGTTVTPRAPGEGKPKVGGWLSLAWFLYPHFDIRVDAIKRTAEDVSLLGQLHVYL
ncbi:MAG TPA: hypothetical protein VHP33_12870 [Polyangiaceae bacterium]|nr:hypothetical protein [Polyangiaceae bacterium]